METENLQPPAAESNNEKQSATKNKKSFLQAICLLTPFPTPGAA